MRTPFAAALMGAVLLACPPATAAASYCGAAAGVVGALAQDYDEHLIAAGASQQRGQRVELYASDDGATWTLIVVWPERGRACMVAAGKRWRAAPLGDPA